MCSISGAFAFSGAAVDQSLMRTIEKRSLERGRDSMGRYTNNRKGVWVAQRSTHEPLKPFAVDANIVLTNNRAEPTTEWQRKKTTETVQPYFNEDLVYIHNGTIANDKELARAIGVPEPAIDSQIIGPVLAGSGVLTPDNMIERLSELVGSYALAVHQRTTDTLYLAANYKPIYHALYDGVLYFASMPYHLPYYGTLQSTVQKLSPYSVLMVLRDGAWLKFPIPTERSKRVLVVASGGMDSTVVASKLVAEGREVALLHVEYGARAQTRESDAVGRVAEHLGVELITVRTDIFTAVIRASRLTSTQATFAEGIPGAELAIEWVPARNLIMASLAVGIAEARGYSEIALGNNLEESGAYPDNEQEFIHQLNQVMPNAVNLGKWVRFTQPVGNLMKHEIVALGLKHNAPLHLAWSCYNNGGKHCGNCGPCFMRRTAFKMNGLTDEMEYAQ